MSRIRFSAGSFPVLTRTEFVFLLVVFVILGLVCVGPVRSYIRDVPIRHAVENARTISTLLSQYATDNDGVYPVGEGTTATGKSEGIARSLLANNYTPDPALFAFGATVRYSGKAADFADFSAANIGWDFTAATNASTGITTAAPGTLPVVYSTGETVTYGPDLDLKLSGTGPFGKTGVVVAYKDNTVKFIPAVPSSNNAVCPGFLSQDFRSTGPYTQIKP